MKKIIEQPDVQFILTGGTIDSYYDATKDTAVPNRHSVIPEYIKSLKINNKVIFTQVCMKDSRSLTQNDRKKILETIEKSVSKKIIITHGTYTMPDTAKYLQANLKRKKR
jgi:L-asparaginase